MHLEMFFFFCLLPSSPSGFTWNVEEDFKLVPDTWIPAHGVKQLNGRLVPDEHGHIPGLWPFVGRWVRRRVSSTCDRVTVQAGSRWRRTTDSTAGTRRWWTTTWAPLSSWGPAAALTVPWRSQRCRWLSCRNRRWSSSGPTSTETLTVAPARGRGDQTMSCLNVSAAGPIRAHGPQSVGG